MNTLKIEHFFEGFTHDQTAAIAVSAQHFSRRNHKDKRRMPTCTMNGETFKISAVTSEELRHSVKRFPDNKWIEINGPAVINWESKGTPPGTPADAAPLPFQSPAQIVERMHRAADHASQAKAHIDLALRELWGVIQVEGYREELVELYARTSQVHKILRRYIDDAAK